MGRPKKEVSQENFERFQKELELAGNQVDILLKDKKGRSKSCLFCRRRKQRCDHKLPSCTACLKAGVRCIQPARYTHVNKSEPIQEEPELSSKPSPTTSTNSVPETTADVVSTSPSSVLGTDVDNANKQVLGDDKKTKKGKTGIQSRKRRSYNVAGLSEEYSSLLEKKLKYLEALIELQPGSAAYNSKIGRYKKICHLLGEVGDLESLVTEGSASTTPSPALPSPYISHTPSSSGILSAFNPQIPNQQKLHSFQTRYPQQTPIYTPNPDDSEASHILRDIPALTSDSVDSIDFSKCIFAKYSLKQFLLYDPVFEFDEKLSRLFLDTYFTRLQFKYPLLDEQEIYNFHHCYIRNKIHSYSETEFHFACGRMWLVFSISACLYMTSGKKIGLAPVRYFSTAIRHITRCGQNLTYLQQVELLTLLVLYVLRTDRDSSVLYEIIKDVMSICKNKLHMNKFSPQDLEQKKKLRLFWSVYLLERMICISVWKPYTISESEIDLPLLSEDCFIFGQNLVERGRHSHNVYFFNQSLQLRRIESHFVETLQILPQVHTNKETLKHQLPLVKRFFHDLEVWRSGCSRSNFRNYEIETLKLYYYRSVRLLIQPYLEVLAPENRLFRECQAAAGQICQLYKIFHQKTVHGHTTPAVHIVFVAGVTLIYCMWLTRNYDDQRRKTLGDESKHTRPHVSASLFSTMDDLRACSVCLYAMTERSDFARIFRDTFDQLMNATIGNLIERCGPDSSELIYISSGKNDVVIKEENSHSSKLSYGEIDNDGMPPAVNRIFGKRQGQEYVGFVENSQVDREETKDFKRRKKVLENTSLPRGLSHLLINTATDKGDDNSENDSTDKSSTTNDDEIHSTVNTEMDKRRINEIMTDREIEVMKNQYIIKKPDNYKDFDWKPFEQQAYLQQHVARQNLQAYLSSLNSSQVGDLTPTGNYKNMNYLSNNFKRDANFVNKPKGSVASAPELFNSNQSIKREPDIMFNNMMGSGHPANPDIQNMNIPTPNIPNNSATTISNNPGTPNEVHSSAQNHVQISQPMSIDNSHPIPVPPDANFGSILFSNGAHDMINNISTWTTDYISALSTMNSTENDLFAQANTVLQGDVDLLSEIQPLVDYNNSTVGLHMKQNSQTQLNNGQFPSGFGQNIVSRNRLPSTSRSSWNPQQNITTNDEFWKGNSESNYLR
ncbi:hypothetical protein Kpol_1009p5 [Vanderwaltozyma polyspora DSM 70294]|uniref:Zn(2)-C6 fungal-type domain-containing protein n=1 Tax=Vanderwaltozyma polyspora (strain ATCC 22028 / DSM 70294 / BCRC 21397 / CBS 2163 / NBRC 10782 / NRRL Y-8283 / UCD 57-17) TaxID=436907 RepID=A7TPD1_VANPO|nr:uncharacterized protein Kpol_1009p5 [Vanderwaltozyma polyspora DSM 70294]EDO15859.1 hypothetical protein Kpol_1009p5 [Vanderwaltozyma polyspora DSM 70294]